MFFIDRIEIMKKDFLPFGFYNIAKILPLSSLTVVNIVHLFIKFKISYSDYVTKLMYTSVCDI